MDCEPFLRWGLYNYSQELYYHLSGASVTSRQCIVCTPVGHPARTAIPLTGSSKLYISIHNMSNQAAYFRNTQIRQQHSGAVH